LAQDCLLTSPDHISCTFRFATMLKLIALWIAAASGMELDKSTWDAATAGKTVFVKFQAPW